ncbi:hypothetical protein OIU79_019179 [Salix purpurea]|uniref:Uncharacterized protein n=1 Tax=Salix purpurea TaxID=77065 RepID=A0A9Q0SJJ4_SALPP|nr:hypothetical protein OIU79_019179 [Salix purpurea]
MLPQMGENESASSLNLVEKTWEEIVIEIPEDLETTFRQEEMPPAPAIARPDILPFWTSPATTLRIIVRTKPCRVKPSNVNRCISLIW